MKRRRQEAILRIVRSEKVATQDELVKTLRKKDIAATQVSISRDIAELGLSKVNGRYHAGDSEASAADPDFPFRAWVKKALPAGPHLVVLSCEVGTAQRVGIAVDQLAMPDTVGTLAGDDSVFIALANAAANEKLLRFFRSHIDSNKSEDI